MSAPDAVNVLTAKLGIAMGRNEMLAKALQASVDIMKSYRYMGYGDEVYMDTLCQAIRDGERALDLHREKPIPAPNVLALAKAAALSATATEGSADV